MSILTLILLAIIAITCSLGQANCGPIIELSDKSYVLKYSLIIVQTDRSGFEYDVDEIYSSWQKRSRARYRQKRKWSYDNMYRDYKGFEDAILYADQQQVASLNLARTKCIAKSDTFANLLFNKKILESTQIEPQLVGLSKFFKFVQDNPAQSSGAYSCSIPKELSNYDKSEEYVKYDYKPGSNSCFTLFYHQDEVKNFPYNVPSHLGACFSDSKTSWIHYYIKSVEIIPNEPIYGSLDGIARPLDLGTAPIMFDRLAIKPAIGCGQALKEVASITSELSATNNFHFSFRAQFKTDTIREPIEISVGYDTSIATLRTERRTSVKFTSTLTNFHLGLTYHIIERINERDDILDDLLKVRHNDRLDNEQSCIVLRTPRGPAESTGDKKFNLGELLLGSGKFIYLGKARIRGIEASVYESFDSSWPFWVQLPAMYHTTPDWVTVNEQVRRRPNKSPVDSIVLNTVIYVNNPTGDNRLLNSKLLQVEVYKLNKRDLQTIEKYSFEVFDFTWKLSSDSANGLVGSERFFSLGDACSSPSVDDNHYGQVDLALQRDWPLLDASKNSDWLEEATKRNFALMQMFQESGSLPISMIYDIDSRVKRSLVAPSSALKSTINVQATFRAASHPRSLVQLVYIGRGELLASNRAQFRAYLAVTFQVCYFVAAHQKINTLFAYDASSRKCYMHDKDITGNTIMFVKASFKIAKDGDGSLEIYRVRHADKLASKLNDELTMLGQDPFVATLDLVNPSDSSARVEFRLKTLEVSQLDEKSAYELDEVQFSDANKFLGFGLVRADKQNRAIVDQQSSNRNTAANGDDDSSDARNFEHLAMGTTFGHCRAECLADFECRSFSVCVRNSKLECIVSKVSFKDPNLVLQLMQFKAKKTKLGEEVSLNIDESETIQVKKHPSCELHNKIYKDLFAPMKVIKGNLYRRSLHPVSDREHCANLCVDKTIQVLKQDVLAAHEASYTALNNPESDTATIETMFKSFKYAHKGMCDQFLYLDTARFRLLDKTAQEVLEKNVVGTNSDGQTNGYCVLGSTETRDEPKRSGEPNESNRVVIKGSNGKTIDFSSLECEQYEFDFQFMFEQQQGASMHWSALEPEQAQAYTQIMERKVGTDSVNAYAIMKKYLETGANTGTWQLGTREDCAKVCFMQSVVMWPGCKSFDVIEVTQELQMTFCFFNIISMRDALHSERFDLISTEPGKQTRLPNAVNARVVHYEPKPGFITGSLTFANQLEAAESYVDSHPSDSGTTFKIGHFGMFITVLVALLIGVVFGIKMGQRALMITSAPSVVDDNVVLVEPPVLEFSNLVNFEGRIPDDQPEAQEQ